MSGIKHSITVRCCKCGITWSGGNSKYCAAGHAYQFKEVEYVPASQLAGAAGILKQAVEELDGWRDNSSDMMRDENVDDFVEAAKAFLSADDQQRRRRSGRG